MGFTTINSKEDSTEQIDRKNSTVIQEKRKVDNIRGKTWVDYTRVETEGSAERSERKINGYRRRKRKTILKGGPGWNLFIKVAKKFYKIH